MNSQQAVVDLDLNVRGFTRLRVVDDSVMPIISANTNAPTIMIAKKIIETIKADPRLLSIS